MIQVIIKPVRYFNPDYLKTILIRKRGLADGDSIPLIESYSNEVVFGGSRLNDYEKVCEFSGGQHVPVTYPHILAFELHAKNMLSKKFPIPLMGIVHVSNKIEQLRPISRVEAVNLKCFINGERRTERGIEFDLMAEARSGDEVIWKSSSTMLYRQKNKSTGPKKTKAHTEFTHADATSEQWKLPRNLGRMYAQNSGDFNPIHLYPATAKLFGFKTTIIHGMWSLARSLGEFDKFINEAPVTIDAEFKLPCYIPSRTTFRHWQNSEAVNFGMLSADGKKPHVIGKITKGVQS
jgi:hypothetical protein